VADPIKPMQMKQDLPENARMLQSGDVVVENEPGIDLANGAVTVRDRLPAAYDGTFVSRERMKEMGVSDQEGVKWKLDPRTHPNTINTLDNWLWEPGKPGRRVIKNPYNKADHVHNMDCILCAYPLQEDIDAAASRLAGQAQFLQEVAEGDYAGIPRHRPESLEEMADRGRYEAAIHAQMGLIGQFAGRPWQDVLKLYGRDWWERTQAEHRGGPVGEEYADEDAVAALDERRARARKEPPGRRERGGKFISIPQNVRPKNVSQKLR